MLYVLCAKVILVSSEDTALVAKAVSQIWDWDQGLPMMAVTLSHMYIDLGCCHLFITSPMYRKNAKSILQRGKITADKTYYKPYYFQCTC